MAGRGPAPKPAATRQRTNRKAGFATLDYPAAPRVPSLPIPARGYRYHRLTRDWWRVVWMSPMSSEFLPTDVSGLGRLALLLDQFHKTLDPKLMAEIRQQEARFGLSPVDRSRLQWEIAKGDEAERKRRPAARQDVAGDDPRDALRVVS